MKCVTDDMACVAHVELCRSHDPPVAMGVPVYTIRHGTVSIGRSRLETPWELTGHAQGVFEPTAAFSTLSDRLTVIAAAVDERLAIAVHEGHIPSRLVDDFREMHLLSGDSSHAWIDLEVMSSDGRVLNARVDGFAETSPGRWLTAVTVNDAQFWRRAVDQTL